ncbi:unnamed protein product [Macrosiphum euphorbiae]|uniref:Uncharacterized protein n=1 Tax=Macrosiphum euphorbiae TaxID=13131 RepID=A0AAV0Y179_9HEMI|nr:unnamed protein product [Macrosiphum euphorbiae]
MARGIDNGKNGRWDTETNSGPKGMDELEEDMNPDNVIDVMLKNQSNWETVKRFVNHVQTIKEKNERL